MGTWVDRANNTKELLLLLFNIVRNVKYDEATTFVFVSVHVRPDELEDAHVILFTVSVENSNRVVI